MLGVMPIPMCTPPGPHPSHHHVPSMIRYATTMRTGGGIRQLPTHRALLLRDRLLRLLSRIMAHGRDIRHQFGRHDAPYSYRGYKLQVRHFSHGKSPFSTRNWITRQTTPLSSRKSRIDRDTYDILSNRRKRSYTAHIHSNRCAGAVQTFLH